VVVVYFFSLSQSTAAIDQRATGTQWP